MNEQYFKRKLDDWIKDPKEARSREDAAILGHIVDCRSGNYISFSFLKDLPRQDLFLKYGVYDNEYNLWEKSYNEMSALVE